VKIEQETLDSLKQRVVQLARDPDALVGTLFGARAPRE
jgi:hypothetical protein